MPRCDVLTLALALALALALINCLRKIKYQKSRDARLSALYLSLTLNQMSNYLKSIVRLCRIKCNVYGI